MPSPKSPLTTLVEALDAAPSLRGFGGKSKGLVLLGKDRLARGRSAPSIVLFPATGPLKVPSDNVNQYADVVLVVTARLWGRDIDEAWDLRARYIAALWFQANPDPLNPDDSIAGPYFALESETWDIVPDTAQLGQELEVDVAFRFAASDEPLTYGQVDAESLERTATLLVGITAADTTAVVEATEGYPGAGVVHLDGEQAAYSGKTATSFTGLVRGINGTAPAPHASGTTISVTPT
jgi:hypothetical protein